MDRADRIGFWVSGVAHAGLLGFAVIGGALFRPQPLDAIRMAEVSTMSEAEFQALASAAEGRGPIADLAETTPAQPRQPDDEVIIGAPEVMSPPAPEANSALLGVPVERPEARPDLSDVRNHSRPTAVETLVSQPAQPQETGDQAVLPGDAARPEPVREAALAPAPLAQQSAAAPIDVARPNGRPNGLAEAVQARREAEEATRQRELTLAREAEETAAEEAAAARRKEAAARRAAEARALEERRENERREQAEAAARDAAKAEERARRQAAAEAAEREDREAAARKAAEKKAAQEAAAAEKAEAQKAAEKKAAAAEARARQVAEEKADAARAAKEAAAEKKAAEEKRAAEKKAAEKAAAEAKAKEKAEAERKAAKEAEKKKAQAEAKKDKEGSGGSGGGGAAVNGPPLSQGEKDGFRVAVEACWNRGSLSTEASRTKVSVQFSMTPDGMPESKSLRMIDHNGPSDAVAEQAYKVARRAILKCAIDNGGYKLPPEKYNRWKDIVIDFNPGGKATIN